MLETIKTSVKELFTNRYLATLTIVTILLALLFIVYIILTVSPSELQLVTHYTAYGVTHFYRDQWYYLLTFAVFVVLVACIHSAIAIKLYLLKGHPLALLFSWLGIAIIVFAWITSYMIIRVWTP